MEVAIERGFLFSLKHYLEEFFKSKIYIILVSLMVFLAWFSGKNVVGYYLLFSLLCVVLLTQTNLTGAIPLIATFLFSYSGSIKMSSIYIFCIIMLPITLISAIYFVAKNHKTFNKKIGKMFFAFLALVVIVLIGGIFANNKFNAGYYLLIAGFGLIILLLYIVFNSTVHSDISNYFAFLMLCIGLIMTAQVFGFLLTQQDIMESLKNKTLTAGWGVSNAMALVTLMCLPFALYLGATNRYYGFIYHIIAVIFLVTILFTQGRSSILTALIFTIPLIVYTVCISKQKIATAVFYGVVAIAVIVVTCLCWQDIKQVFEFLLKTGIEDRGRLELYEEGIKEFFANPIFGSGIWASSEKVGFINWYHNTIIQFLATGGIIGIALFLYHQVVKYKIVATKCKYAFGAYAMFGLILSEMYGMLDIIYFAPQYLILLLFILLAVEKFNPDCNKKTAVN